MDEVEFNLNPSTVTVILNVLTLGDIDEALGGAVKTAIEGLDDLGGAGDAIRDGLLKVIPNGSAVQPSSSGPSSTTTTTRSSTASARTPDRGTCT